MIAKSSVAFSSPYGDRHRRRSSLVLGGLYLKEQYGLILTPRMGNDDSSASSRHTKGQMKATIMFFRKHHTQFLSRLHPRGETTLPIRDDLVSPRQPPTKGQKSRQTRRPNVFTRQEFEPVLVAPSRVVLPVFGLFRRKNRGRKNRSWPKPVFDNSLRLRGRRALP